MLHISSKEDIGSSVTPRGIRLDFAFSIRSLESLSHKTRTPPEDQVQIRLDRVLSMRSFAVVAFMFSYYINRFDRNLNCTHQRSSTTLGILRSIRTRDFTESRSTVHKPTMFDCQKVAFAIIRSELASVLTHLQWQREGDIRR
jgi:hypothetical protein